MTEKVTERRKGLTYVELHNSWEYTSRSITRMIERGQGHVKSIGGTKYI
jgi:hypothetical protein